MTLGAAAAAQVRLIVWCKACQHQVEPDPAEMAALYGEDTSVLDWRSGWYVQAAAADRSIWFSAALSADGRSHSLAVCTNCLARFIKIVGG
jgi:hypothetical protein